MNTMLSFILHSSSYSIVVKVRLTSIRGPRKTKAVFRESYMACGGLLRLGYPMGRDTHYKENKREIT